MDIKVKTPSIGGLVSRFGGLVILFLVVCIVAALGHWAIFGENVPSWAAMIAQWMFAMAVIWLTLQVLSKGFGASTSLDEFLELLNECVKRVRTGQPIETALALVLVATAIRSGLLLLAAAFILTAVLEYQHPQG